MPLAASASPWIHLLIGARWADAASAVPPACFAMVFSVPISVALAGYLWAIGSASVPMRATAVGIPATLLLLLLLLPFLGVAAAGVAYIASGLVESVFFVYAARRTMTLRIGGRLGIPVLLATVSASVGWLVARWIGPDLVGALSSSVVALGLFVGGFAAVHRAALADALVAYRARTSRSTCESNRLADTSKTGSRVMRDAEPHLSGQRASLAWRQTDMGASRADACWPHGRWVVLEHARRLNPGLLARKFKVSGRASTLARSTSHRGGGVFSVRSSAEVRRLVLI